MSEAFFFNIIISREQIRQKPDWITLERVSVGQHVTQVHTHTNTHSINIRVKICMVWPRTVKGRTRNMGCYQKLWSLSMKNPECGCQGKHTTEQPKP